MKIALRLISILCVVAVSVNNLGRSNLGGLKFEIDPFSTGGLE